MSPTAIRPTNSRPARPRSCKRSGSALRSTMSHRSARRVSMRTKPTWCAMRMIGCVKSTRCAFSARLTPASSGFPHRTIKSTLVVSSPISGRVVPRSAAPGFLTRPGNAPAPFQVADRRAFLKAERRRLTDHGHAGFIWSAHLAKALFAAERLSARFPAAEPRLLAAVNRFLHARPKRRNILRTARQMRAFVAAEQA